MPFKAIFIFFNSKSQDYTHSKIGFSDLNLYVYVFLTCHC